MKGLAEVRRKRRLPCATDTAGCRVTCLRHFSRFTLFLPIFSVSLISRFNLSHFISFSCNSLSSMLVLLLLCSSLQSRFRCPPRASTTSSTSTSRTSPPVSPRSPPRSRGTPVRPRPCPSPCPRSSARAPSMPHGTSADRPTYSHLLPPLANLCGRGCPFHQEPSPRGPGGGEGGVAMCRDAAQPARTHSLGSCRRRAGGVRARRTTVVYIFPQSGFIVNSMF